MITLNMSTNPATAQLEGFPERGEDKLFRSTKWCRWSGGGGVAFLLGIEVGHGSVTSDPLFSGLISEEGTCNHITSPQSSGSPLGGADGYNKP